jgi:DNA-binding transcriptional LysR family regulator
MSTCQLRIFVAVARPGNFTRAAERLLVAAEPEPARPPAGTGSPGPAVRSQHRSVALTRAGDDFLPIAERLLDDFQSAVAA